jgi:peptide/nickel transport system substrate-binding protein
MDPELQGVSTDTPWYPNYGNWSHPTQTLITVQTPADYIDFNPLQQGSYYDGLATEGIYEGLVTRFKTDPNTYVGELAENWTTSADQLTWTFTLRQGIKFSDGTDFNADDVVYTYQQYLNPDTNCYGATSLATYLNASNVEKVDDYTVKFTMNKFYAYQISNFGLSILSKEQMSQLTAEEWITDPATNKQYAPVGTGPYMMDETGTDIATGDATLILNPEFTVSRGHPFLDNPDRIPTIKVVLITSAASCVAALDAGAIDIIDSNVALQPFMDEINSSANMRLIQTVGSGHQGFYVNQYSPIWGNNPDDPREMYPEDYESAPFDLTAVFFAILMLASIQIIRKRK